MKVRLQVERSIIPFKVPMEVYVEAPCGRKEDGFVPKPAIRLPQLDAELLSQLCDTFRRDVFRYAGKIDPRSRLQADNPISPVETAPPQPIQNRSRRSAGTKSKKQQRTKK